MTLDAVPWQAAPRGSCRKRRWAVAAKDSVGLWKQNPSDSEEVGWALSTAEALLGRGERAEAIKWVRRAAEQASDDGADDRSLELAKAVGELAALVASAPPPPPEAPAPPAPEAPAPPPAAAEPERVSTPAPASRRASTLISGPPPAPPVEAAPPPPPPPPPLVASEPARAADPALADLQRKAPPLPGGARASVPPPIPPLPPASEKSGDVVAALAELSSASPKPPAVDERPASQAPPAVSTQMPSLVATQEPPAVATHEPPAVAAPSAPAQAVPTAHDALPLSQAIKVIVAPLSGPAARVFRADTGVHRPAGSFEAILVALSPDADMASIFSKK
jgi:hypothetical protein